jgi:mRNA interferase HigB
MPVPRSPEVYLSPRSEAIMDHRHKNRVISRKKIREFLETHPEHQKATAVLDRWYKTALHARWGNFSQVRETYSNASAVGKFVVFNVGGNKFRIITIIHYNKSTIFIRYVMTHEEYDEDKWKT